MRILSGPITRTRAKEYKNSLQALVRDIQDWVWRSRDMEDTPSKLITCIVVLESSEVWENVEKSTGRNEPAAEATASSGAATIRRTATSNKIQGRMISDKKYIF